MHFVSIYIVVNFNFCKFFCKYAFCILKLTISFFNITFLFIYITLLNSEHSIYKIKIDGIRQNLSILVNWFLNCVSFFKIFLLSNIFTKHRQNELRQLTLPSILEVLDFIPFSWFYCTKKLIFIIKKCFKVISQA